MKYIQYDDNMYFIRYVCMLGIYISEVSTMTAQKRYIHKIQNSES